MTLKRRSFPEIEDFPWLPRPIRDGATDYLAFLQRLLGPYGDAPAVVNEILAESGEEKILDLCSGAGGPLAALSHRLKTLTGEPPEIELSDRYPNLSGELGSTGLRYRREPLDARCVPAGAEGLRTLFTAFHHFTPMDGRAILSSAAESGRPIVVFEVTERTFGSLLRVAALSFALFLLTPCLRPQRMSRYLFTYALPLIPLVVFWDGIASSLKSYTLEELRSLAPSVPGYVWKAGSLRSVLGARVLYLAGTPVRHSAASGLRNNHEDGKRRRGGPMT